jgi:hypothetical protein
LVESFEALNVYSDSVFVAVTGPVEGILFRVAETSEIAHCGFEFYVRWFECLSLLASLDPVSTMTGCFAISKCDVPAAVSVDVLKFSAAVAAGGDEVGRVVFAEDG